MSAGGLSGRYDCHEGPRQGRSTGRRTPVGIETNVNAQKEVEASEVGASRARSGARRPVDDAPSWAEALGTSGIVQILILIALVSWLYHEHFFRFYVYWKQPDWSHGFLIPFFTLYLINLKRRELVLGEHPGSLWGVILIALSLAMDVTSIYLKIGYPQSLSIVGVIAGVVLAMRGWRTLKITLFPIGFLLLAIPPPERLYRSFTQPLQQGAATVSSFILEMCPGSDIEQSGINIAYYMRGGHQGFFTVAGACSGMRSLMAFVALGLATAYFTPRPTWQRVAMAIVVVPVALICNVLRVIITGVFQMYDYGDLASGTPHTVLGMLTFAMGFAIYLGFLWILDHLYLDETAGRTPACGGSGSS